jgi:thioredoxin 1
MSIDVTEQTFEAEVLGMTMPVLVDFGAKWCGPCRKLSPVLDEIESTLEGKVKVVKVDADENRGLMQKYSVSGLPSLLVFKNGEPVERMAGLVPKSTIISNVEKHL